MTDTPKKTKGLTRRSLLKTASAAAGLAAGSGAITGFPTIWAQNPITLRQFGTGVSNLNAIAEKCKADLGITLEMTATDSDAAAQRAVTQPNSYDIADIEYWILKKVFPAGVIQPMDTKKLKYYDKVVPLFKNGKLKPDSVIAQGTAPHTVGYVEKPGDKAFAKSETEWFTMMPTIYNADTLGIRPDLVGREITTWADIMDPAFKGKTSILNIPSIGIMDAAMIMEAMGNIKYADKGNMTRAEIDATIDFLIKAKKDGQFRAFWKSFDESVNLMASGEVIIQSMWSPAVAAFAPRALPANTSRSRKAIVPGVAALVSPRIFKARSSMPHMNTSTGTRRVGLVLTSIARATTRLPWKPPRNSCPQTNGATGSRASRPRAISSRPMARSWKRPVRFAMAARSMSAWARSRAGTPSWTKTATWSAAGTSSSLLDLTPSP